MSSNVEDDVELTEFVFEDAEKYLKIWIDGYAADPEWAEPEWQEHPDEYRNALACGYFGATKDGANSSNTVAPSWISTGDLLRLQGLVNDFVDGLTTGFNLFPVKGLRGRALAPIRFGMRRENGEVVLKVVVDVETCCLDYSIEQVLTRERLKDFRTYLARLVERFPVVV